MRNTEFVNLEDLQLLEIEEISVQEWHPQEGGAGKPTQVHVLLEVKGSKTQLVLRIKSRERLTEIVSALITHGLQVWPTAPRSSQRKEGQA